MKKKVVISIVAIVILILAIIAVIIINNNIKQNDAGKDSGNPEEASDTNSFSMEYPDRLCGVPFTGKESDSSMIEARYGDVGFVRKTLGTPDNSDGKTDYAETVEQTVNGMSVTFKGNVGLVYLAVWYYNNFTYSISVSQGVTIDEMIEYIETIR